MANKVPTPQDAHEACALFDALSTEVYYGLNFRTILSEATPEERAAVRVLVDRAKTWRDEASKRKDNRVTYVAKVPGSEG